MLGGPAPSGDRLPSIGCSAVRSPRGRPPPRARAAPASRIGRQLVEPSTVRRSLIPTARLQLRRSLAPRRWRSASKHSDRARHAHVEGLGPPGHGDGHRAVQARQHSAPSPRCLVAEHEGASGPTSRPSRSPARRAATAPSRRQPAASRARSAPPAQARTTTTGTWKIEPAEERTVLGLYGSTGAAAEHDHVDARWRRRIRSTVPALPGSRTPDTHHERYALARWPSRPRHREAAGRRAPVGASPCRPHGSITPGSQVEDPHPGIGRLGADHRHLGIVRRDRSTRRAPRSARPAARRCAPRLATLGHEHPLGPAARTACAARRRSRRTR